MIVSYARTPIGSFLGVLADVPATQLGSMAIKCAVSRAGKALETVCSEQDRVLCSTETYWSVFLLITFVC